MLRVLFLASLLLLLHSLVDILAWEYGESDARRSRAQFIAAHKARVLKAKQPGSGGSAYIPCKYDLMCGRGDCWVGFCADSGFCRTFHNCS